MTLDLFTGATGRTDDGATLAALEVDYTPPAVAVQLLLGLREVIRWQREVKLDVRCALDPAAGSGCWGRAVRAVFGESAQLVGVEMRPSEEANLAAAYDTSFILTLERFVECARGGVQRFDLVAGNTPFTAFGTDDRAFWPTLLLDAGLLTDHALVAFYGLSQWGQSAEAQQHIAAWCPWLQLRLGGRPAHREDGKTDAREYSLWVWSVADRRLRQMRDRNAVGPVPLPTRASWRTVQLPALPVEYRRWSPTAVPGTYPIDPALVAEISERYL
jgi:hypothetical protein